MLLEVGISCRRLGLCFQSMLSGRAQWKDIPFAENRPSGVSVDMGIRLITLQMVIAAWRVWLLCAATMQI